MRSELFHTDNAGYYLVYTHHGDLSVYGIPMVQKMGAEGFPADKMPIVKDAMETVQPFLDHANRQAYPTMEDIFHKDNIKGLDAIVLESLNTTSHYVNYTGQYKMIIDNVFSSGKDIPMYLVDVTTEWDEDRSHMIAGGIGLALTATGIAIGAVALKNYIDRKKGEGVTRRDFLRLMKRTAIAATGTAAGLYFLGGHLAAPYHLGYSRGEAGKLPRYAVYVNTEVFPTKIINLRNAVWSRKIDDFIAPHLNKRLGRPPKIAVVSGAMHAGMEWYLKSKSKRDSAIGKYKRDIEKIEHTDLNYIMELTPDGKDNFGDYQWKSNLLYRPFF